MKILNTLLTLCLFAVAAMKIEAGDELPCKFARTQTSSPIATAALLVILSPQAIALPPRISKLDLWKNKMSHVSRRLDGDSLVSTLQGVDRNNVGIISQRVFDIVQDLHNFRIDVSGLPVSEISQVDPWNVSKKLYKFMSVNGIAAIEMQREPYMQDIMSMMGSDYIAIQKELVYRGLYREPDLLKEPLSKEIKDFYDRACKLRADLVEGEKSKLILECELNDLEQHQPVYANLTKNMHDKIKRLKTTLSTYEKNPSPINKVAVRRIFSEAEILAQELFLSKDQSQQDDQAEQYQQLVADYEIIDFGNHEREAAASLLCVKSLLKNNADEYK